MNSREYNPMLRAGSRFVSKYFDWRLFLKHYVSPILDRRERIPYDPEKMFAKQYSRTLEEEGIGDGLTLGFAIDPLYARYHYAGVEMTIIEHLIYRGYPQKPAVLDIGCATGHWIDFYLSTFGAREVVGIDIADPIVAAARERFSEHPNVDIRVDDVSRPDFDLGRRFEIVNAIGVMFHIVEDDKWQQAISNLARHLTPGGVMLVGGMFGLITQDVQRFPAEDGRRAIVQKRIRSRARWRQAAKTAGCRLVRVRRTRRGNIVSRETNVALLVRDT